MKWTAIVEEDKVGKFGKKLTEIEEVVRREYKNMDKENLGLMGGKVGTALFLFYYSKYKEDDTFSEMGMELIEEVFEKVNDGFTYHTFAGGLAGIGWVVDHLFKTGFIEGDSNETLEDIDEYLHKAMILEIQNKQFDYLHAGIGLGIYFLSRLESGKSKDYLVECVDELDKISIKEEGGGIKWRSTLEREKKSEGFNMSLSHGISSIIVFLSRVIAAGIHKDKAAALLEGAVTFLLQHEMDTTKYHSMFPSWVAEKPEVSIPPSRLAWCYGDLGNTLALWQAGKSMNKKEWQDKAVETILFNAKRLDVKEQSVRDAGLCHGSFGLAHIYNRMYQLTGKELCKTTARYWFDESLKFDTYEDGFAGYKSWRMDSLGGPVNDLAFLEGVSGMGLALISFLSDTEPLWDRALLMS